MIRNRTIYCCGCGKQIIAVLIKGKEVYPYRKELYRLPFWKCVECNNFVGCHHKNNSNPLQPLGCIATQEIKNARKHIHKILDPLWKSGQTKRGCLYKKINEKLGHKYHTANIRTIEDARKIYKIIIEISNKL